jgi:predicted PurR-regulated permease PerM
MVDLKQKAEETIFIRKLLEATIRIGILVLLATWSFQIFRPFLGPVVWGMIIAVATHGLFGRLRNALGGRNGLAATVFTLIALAILVTPTVMLSESMLKTAQVLTGKIEAGQVEVPPPPEAVAKWPVIGDTVYDGWKLASDNLEEAVADIKPQIRAFSSWLLSTAVGTGLGVLAFAFAIILAGVFLANAPACAKAARDIAVRLAGERGHVFVDLAHDTISSVARGVLGIAVIQTFFLALGLIVSGMPAAGILSVLTLLFAIAQIPMLLLYLPLVAFYFSMADTTPAVIFAVWSIFFCFADGFLKPLLLGRGLSVPMLVILIGVVGGMLAYGIIGLFIGPIILAFSYSLYRVWLDEDRTPDSRQGALPVGGEAADPKPG